MIENVILAGVLLLLCVLALLTVHMERLFTAVVYAGTLSAAAAFAYMLLGAPDVALAEAVIGSTLSTVVFLVTLKKYKIFVVRFLPEKDSASGSLKKVMSVLSRSLEKKEMEVHVLQASEPVETLLSYEDTDLVVEQKSGHVVIHGEQHSEIMERIKHSFHKAGIVAKYAGSGDEEHFHSDPKDGHLRHRWPALIFIIVIAASLFYGYYSMGAPGAAVLWNAIRAVGIRETGAQNLVAAIYLDYRLFDTLLEALLLLVSVIGVSQFAGLSKAEQIHPEVNQNPMQDKPSHVMLGSLSIVYVFLALFGGYVIVTGMDGPGGGFQGGALLAAIIIACHFVEKRVLLSFSRAARLEKIMYVLILALGTLYLLFGPYVSVDVKRLHFLLMNIFIGLKVCSGLSLIYLYFMSSGTGKERENG